MKRLALLLILLAVPAQAWTRKPLFQVLPGSPFTGGGGSGSGIGPPLTLDPSGAGNGATVLRVTMSGASFTSNFINVTGTIPTTPTQPAVGALFAFTGAGSAAQQQVGMIVNLNAGYTGNQPTAGVSTLNASANTGTGPNLGFNGQATGAAGLINVGGAFTGAGTPTNSSYGGVGFATSAVVSAGIVGQVYAANNTTQAAGVMATINDGAGPDYSSNITPFIVGKSALMASNGATTYDVARLYDNNTEVWAVGDGGNYRLYRTITAAGTTGARTIDKPAGTVNFAIAAASIVVTDALVTTSSIVFGVMRTADATCTDIKSIVPAAGSFTITLNAGCAAETSVGFLVTN